MTGRKKPGRKKGGVKKGKEVFFEHNGQRISVGEFLRGVGELIDMAIKKAEKEGERKKGATRGVSGVWGLKIRTREGKTLIEDFGDIRETAKGPVLAKRREPVFDVHDMSREVVVSAEIPGVDRKDIRVEVKGDLLVIKAGRGNRRYTRDDIVLPAGVDPRSVKFTYKNGVLEVRVRKLGKG